MAVVTRRARAGGPVSSASERRTAKRQPTTLGRRRSFFASFASSSSSLAALVRSSFARLLDPSDTMAACLVAAALLAGEALLCALIIVKVPYTEIDWEAYMEEVGGFLSGERDYKNLKGGTGPLVYPAGFVYLYSALSKITGGSVRPAQWIFGALYLATHLVVLALYVKSKVVPPLALALLSLSKRLHSIYVLRCFNDGVAALAAWAATLLLVEALSCGSRSSSSSSSSDSDSSSSSSSSTLKERERRESKRHSPLVVASVAAFSLAVSVKMNVLLMAPPVAVLLLQGARLQGIVAGVLVGVLLQVLLALPFLATFPGSYLGRAFELGRVFTHKWSVNFAFLEEQTFVSKKLALALAVAHLAVLFAFAGWRWTAAAKATAGAKEKKKKKNENRGGLAAAAADCWAASSSSSSSSSTIRPPLEPAHVFRTVAVGNFIGIVFARSLHYQFYSWYAHSIPLLLWSTPFPTPVKLLLWLAIEAVWNSFPPSALGSLALWGAHLSLLAGLWLFDGDDSKNKSRRK